MSRQIQIRRGTSAEHNNFTGAIGEVTMDTTNKTLRVHDGTTVGGHEVLKKNEYLSHITNCITEIQQDIKLELNNGVLTLKAGSKVYAPNGTGNFDTITVTEDKTLTYTANGTRMVALKSNGSELAIIGTTGEIVSGATDDKIGQTYHCWYDTSNNIIYRYGSDGNNPQYTTSFPIAMITVVNNVMTSIDQIYNGFGFVGSVVYVLPGVKGFIPDGKNSDGTMKSIVASNQNVHTYTSASAFSGVIGMNASGEITCYSSLTYNPNTNYNYQNNIPYGRLNAGTIVFGTNGHVSTLSANTSFISVDFNSFAPVKKDIASVITNTKAITASSATNSIVTTTGISKAHNGYVKFGNGIIIQWGEITTTGTSRTITLPTAFSGVNYMVSLIPEAPSGSLYSLMLSNKTSSTVTVTSTGDAADYSFNWIAVGY